MENRTRLSALALIAGLALPAIAQDSISKVQGPTGDAVSPWSTTEQLNTYVVDLAPLTTSWNTSFGIAPIIKSSKTDPAFFTSLISSQSISNTLRTPAAFPFAAYSVWTNSLATPTLRFGVNNTPALNDAPGTVNTGQFSGAQFAVGFAEFSGNANNIIGGVVNYRAAQPARLYVARIPAGVNGAGASENRAQVGYGAVDSDGNIHFRADDFALLGPNPIVEDNLFRVELLGRNASALNIIDNAGGSDAAATDWLVQRSVTSYNTPSVLPEQINGARPVALGSNFAIQYAYEAAAINGAPPPSLTVTGAHLCGSPDQRGNISFSQSAVFAGSVGTAGLLGRDDNNATKALLVWGVTANGAVSGCRRLIAPAAFIDNSDGFNTGSIGTLEEFGNYRSQVAFRGGNGQVAVGKDQAGRPLVAAAAQFLPGGGAQNPINAIAVARLDPADPVGGAVQWTVAAYNNFPNGKQLLDGPGGAAVGQLIELNQIPGAPIGPSMSSPMIDSVGNVWFLSVVERYTNGGPGDPLNDRDTGLVRAVYNPATFAYELELVLDAGRVFVGQNSARNYQLRFIGLADSNSVSSEATFSGNINQSPWNNISTAGLPTRDPKTLGGLVLAAEIVYDVNNDGMFEKVTGAGGNPASLDQEYQVLLYVGNTMPAGSACPVDLNGDGAVTIADFLEFLNLFSAGDPRAEFDGNPGITVGDFLAFLNAFSKGC